MYTQKNIAIVGASRAGVFAAQFLASRGGHVTLYDNQAALRVAQTALATSPIQYQTAHNLNTADLIVVSPEVSWRESSLHAAIQAGREVVSVAELAFRHLQAPMIGICGVRGAPTVAGLVSQMLKESGRKVAFVNESTLLEAAEQPLDWVVASLSFEQLAFSNWLHPRVAGFLNFPTQADDADGEDPAQYTSLLLRMFARMEPNDLVALNLDQDIRPLLPSIPAGRKLYFSMSHPQATVRVVQSEIVVFGGQEKYPISSIKLKGKDSQTNAMASIVIARGAGATADGVQKALARFVGVPHRRELIKSIDGVSFVSDARATHVAITQQTLEGFDPKLRLLLIMGGSDVGGEYQKLSAMVQAKCRGVIAYGDARDEIAAALQGTTLVSPVADLAAAVRLAKVLAQRGDVVIFAPTCPQEQITQSDESLGEAFRTLVG
jgi:UDP-N-acetylmuramoylalanine--D-glutamate ligase